MKKAVSMAGVALALALGAGVSSPEPAIAAEATGSVCQFYRGEPMCKTVTTTSCVGGSAGLEARVCREEKEYWYWS
jgi:hypothetical protein